jgi:UDP-N-acetylglucosamine 4-epimerase
VSFIFWLPVGPGPSQNRACAICTREPDALNQVYNIAFGERTTLNELFVFIKERVAEHYPDVRNVAAVHRDFRVGDVKHSLADIGKAKKLLGYGPLYSVKTGLDEAAKWYIENLC